MKGTVLVRDPPGFKTFELAHRLEDGVPRFEVAYGSSFNELYYDFTPSEFLSSEDHDELELQLARAGAAWLIPILTRMAEGAVKLSTQELQRLAKESPHVG